MERIKCEYCGREILAKPEVRVRRGIKHNYCSEFCYRLHFYNVPRISYEDLKKMYKLRTISIKLES